MQIAAYLEEIRTLHASGQTTEHSFRPALARLFESIDPAVTVINEPKKSDAGMPDFMFNRGRVYRLKLACSLYDLSVCIDRPNATHIEARR